MGLFTRKSRLGWQLLLAFVVIAGAPGLMGVLGWLELRDLADRQSRLIAQTIPAIAEVRGFAEESSRVVAIAPDLAAVTDDHVRRERAAFLFDQVDALRDRIRRYEGTGQPIPVPLSRSESEVRQGIARLDQLVQRRLAAEADQRRRLDEGLTATTELLEITDTLAANVEVAVSAGVASLYDLWNRREALAGMLDRLIEVDLFQLGQMFELRGHVAEIALLLNRIGETRNQHDLEQLRAQLAGRLGVVTRRLETVPDRSRAERALALLRGITPAAVSPPGTEDFPGLTARLIALDGQTAAAQAELRDAALRLDTQAAALADSIVGRATRAGEAAQAAIRRTLIVSAIGSFLALMVSAGVVWFYVRGKITRRLDALAARMGGLRAGDLHEEVVPRGEDEIARMEQAVEVFRLQALENRALAAERDRNLEELRRHREELRQLVDEQTERLRGEVAAHAEARAHAEAADRAKSQFLAMMSHEIRTPMNGVLGLLHGLMQDDLAGRTRDRVVAALASGEGLMSLLNTLLDDAKSLDGDIALRPAPFDPAALVRETAMLMAASAQDKGLWLRVDAPECGWLLGDAARLRQVLFNLLANAIRFTAAGGVDLRLRTEPGPAGVALVLEVADTGKGIAPEAQKRIFGLFEQEDPETARRYGGTGLGLAISRRLAEAMGGTLSVESAPGQGALFRFRAGFPPAEAPAASAPAAPARPLRLLVVEDHPVNRMVLGGYLSRLGHAFAMADCAEEALARLDQDRFDAVLMDVNLPGMSGIEAARAIHRRIEGLPVIGISAHVQPEEIAACHAAGMVEVLSKPLAPADLQRALATVRPGAGPVPAAVLAPALADLPPAQVAVLARLYLDGMAGDMAAIQAALAQGDATAAARAAHRWRGASGNFGLSDLAAALERFECALADGTGAAGALWNDLAVLARAGAEAMRRELALLPA
ncbi:ATP-binding protein [Paracoccus sp. DMF]|uniref:ATP-binding protein n=1 Tax=Paracoccus sp. DMF TaxID=400837 RepID=UPI0021E409C6|nr:ATP-binding protein [Paracoccus sp. DMF]MCV2446137.1 ATP-binding protein [Paracoccus sp. DMF]